MILKIILALFFCIILYGLFTFMIIRVNGYSMYPTMLHNEIYLMKRRKFSYSIDSIYVFDSPYGVPSIKRLKNIEYDESKDKFKLWFEGDNLNNSQDSRSYGYIDTEYVLGKVITNK